MSILSLIYNTIGDVQSNGHYEKKLSTGKHVNVLYMSFRKKV